VRHTNGPTGTKRRSKHARKRYTNTRPHKGKVKASRARPSPRNMFPPILKDPIQTHSYTTFTITRTDSCFHLRTFSLLAHLTLTQHTACTACAVAARAEVAAAASDSAGGGDVGGSGWRHHVSEAHACIRQRRTAKQSTRNGSTATCERGWMNLRNIGAGSRRRPST
jgi:hypothetical protein